MVEKKKENREEKGISMVRSLFLYGTLLGAYMYRMVAAIDGRFSSSSSTSSCITSFFLFFYNSFLSSTMTWVLMDNIKYCHLIYFELIF